MCPPRKSKKEKPEKPPKEVKEKKNKEEHPEPVKVELVKGAGWTPENFCYIKTLPNDQVLNCIYEIFGIPLSFKTDKSKSAIQVFAEFHQSSFQFAQQFTDTSKALNIIAILSDYISSVPAFQTAKDSFATWLEKATTQIKALEFSQSEQQAIITYLNKNIRSNSHILHFVLTKEAVEQAEKDGIKLFRTVSMERNALSDQEALLAQQRQSEFEQQQLQLEQAMKEKKEAEEREKQEQLAQAIQEIMAENFAKIQETLEKRNDSLISQLLALEEQIDGHQKKK